MKTRKERIAIMGGSCVLVFLVSGCLTAACAIWDAEGWVIKTGFTVLLLSFFGIVVLKMLDE